VPVRVQVVGHGVDPRQVMVVSCFLPLQHDGLVHEEDLTDRLGDIRLGELIDEERLSRKSSRSRSGGSLPSCWRRDGAAGGRFGRMPRCLVMGLSQGK
jgi:hypothetical protein